MTRAKNLLAFGKYHFEQRPLWSVHLAIERAAARDTVKLTNATKEEGGSTLGDIEEHCKDDNGMVGEPCMIELTHSAFDPFVASHRFAVVHFWAAWNLYDAEMKSLLAKELPPELRGLIAFGAMRVDPQENHQICRHYPILNNPFLAFYRDGSLVQTLTLWTGSRLPSDSDTLCHRVSDRLLYVAFHNR